MRNLLTISLILLSQFAIGGAHYTVAATSGAVILSNTVIAGHTIVGGDTVDLAPGAIYSQVQARGFNGTSGAHIIVRGNGAYSTSPLSSFQQPYWWDVSYVDFYDLKDSTWYGTHRGSYGIHDVTFNRYIVANGTGVSDTTNFSTQPWWQWDDGFAASSMVFTGSKSQTFYGINYFNCRIQGFKNCGPIAVGTGWGGSGQDNRSIAIDWKLYDDTIQNIINWKTPSGPSGFRIPLISVGFGVGWEVKGLVVREFLDPQYSWTHSHSAVFEFFGQVNFHDNWMDGTFGSLYRITPLSWTGLPGYAGNQINGLAGLPNDGRKVRSYQYNNISHNSRSYSQGEINQNNKGNRNSTNGINPTGDTVVHNTIHRTIGQPDDDRYYGFIVDNVNQDSMFVADNYIISPETDFTFDTVGRSKYAVAIVSSGPSQLTAQNNKPFQTWSSAITDDTISYVPATGSKIINLGSAYSFRTTAYAGQPMNGIPDIGAVERQAGGSVPNCVSNISPGNGTTVAGQTSAALSWNSDGTATSYDLYFDGAFLLNQSGTTYTKTGLSANTSHTFYAIPRNASGPAVSCSGNSTSFTTAIAVPSCTSGLTPTTGSTLLTTTTAALTWSAAATATSYAVWIDGSLVTSVGSTNYNAFGFSASSSHSWYIVPSNGSGSAVSCSGTAFTFTTAAIGHPVKILTVRRK